MNLLLVDDEMFAIQGILDSVNWAGIGIGEVATANSLKQAQAVLQNRKMDILLCDIEMPFGSGVDLVAWVRENQPELLCIFLTAHSNFEFARQAVRLQCFDYILKPARPEIIEKVLVKAMEKIRSTRKDDQYRGYGELYVKEMISEDSSREKSEDVVESCVAYIREHISEPLTVEELAADHYINPDYLTRLFKKKFGQTVTAYIRDQRMFLARELLENTELSVTMISAKTGYDNYSAFITGFKKYYGIPPREYRKKFQEEQEGQHS